VITGDEEVAGRYRAFRDHGYNVEERMTFVDVRVALPCVHDSLGYNFRMVEM